MNNQFGSTEVNEATEAKLDKLMKLSDNSRSSLKLMNGCEVNSLNYEGVVYIKGLQVIQNGETIDTLDDDEKVSDLWSEYVEGEGF